MKSAREMHALAGLYLRRTIDKAVLSCMRRPSEAADYVISNLLRFDKKAVLAVLDSAATGRKCSLDDEDAAEIAWHLLCYEVRSRPIPRGDRLFEICDRASLDMGCSIDKPLDLFRGLVDSMFVEDVLSRHAAKQPGTELVLKPGETVD